MKKKKKYDYYNLVQLPSNLDLSKIMRQVPLANNIKCLKSKEPYEVQDRLAYLCGVVSVHSKGDFTPLCSEFLQPILRDYDKLLLYLVEAEVMESDGILT